MGLARSEGEAGQLGWRGAEEVARMGLALWPTRLAKGAGEEAERGRRWRWAGELAGGQECPASSPVGVGAGSPGNRPLPGTHPLHQEASRVRPPVHPPCWPGGKRPGQQRQKESWPFPLGTGKWRIGEE